MLVTVAEAKAHIPALTSASTADDAFLTTLIGRVDGIFARRTGRPGSAPSMEARTYRLDLAAQSGRELDLEVYPVCSVTSAYVDATGDFEGDEETVTVSDIGVRDATTARLVSTSSSSWSTSPRSNRVSFVAGYNGSSTVTGAHTSSATTITVASTTKFYQDEAGLIRVLVGSEIIHATGRTATTLTGCTRGAEGTTAASISGGATITQPTPDALKGIVCAAVKHLYDQRQTQGLAATAAGALLDAKGDRDYLPDWILAGLGAWMLPRAAA
jgi:hypothetical protein